MRAGIGRISRIIFAAVGVFGCSNAFADDLYFTFTYYDVNLSASGWVDATVNGDGTATAIQGTLLIPSGSLAGSYDLYANANAPGTAISPFGAFIYNDTVYPNAAAGMDVDGLLFTGQGHEINIWGNGAGHPYSFWSSPGSGYDYSSDSGSFVLTAAAGPSAVPVAGPMALLAAGGFVPLCRRPRREGFGARRSGSA